MIRSPAGFDGGVRIKRYLDYYQPSYGVMMLSAGQFSPASLFAAGEQGAWYDPSDFSTMFQDNAGTTPVTAVEQTVGLLLDKSKGLALGAELVTNGTFDTDTTGWTLSAGTATVSGGQVTISGAVTRFLTQAFTTVVGVTYKVTGQIVTSGATFNAIRKSDNATASSNAVTILSSAGTGSGYFVATATTSYVVLQVNDAGTATFDGISVKALAGNHATQATLANRPTLSARVNQLLATATLATQSVTTLAATYTLAFSGAGTVTASGTNAGVYSAGSNSLVCTAGTLTLTVAGSVTLADLRVTNDGVGLPAYQAVVTSTNYSTSGFPLYLTFDGANDGLATSSINFSAIDKMSVFAGMRKLSDVAQAVFTELGATSASGTFTVFAPNVAAPNGDIVFRSRGTVSSNAIAANVAPSTVVMSGLSSISTDISSIRLNGVLIQQNTTDQGTGNFTNNPLYIGRRGGSSLPFNGRLYSLIVRGAQSTDTEIANTETWVNGKTLAY